MIVGFGGLSGLSGKSPSSFSSKRVDSDDREGVPRVNTAQSPQHPSMFDTPPGGAEHCFQIRALPSSGIL